MLKPTSEKIDSSIGSYGVPRIRRGESKLKRSLAKAHSKVKPRLIASWHHPQLAHLLEPQGLTPTRIWMTYRVRISMTPGALVLEKIGRSGGEAKTRRKEK